MIKEIALSLFVLLTCGFGLWFCDTYRDNYEITHTRLVKLETKQVPTEPWRYEKVRTYKIEATNLETGSDTILIKEFRNYTPKVGQTIKL